MTVINSVGVLSHVLVTLVILLGSDHDLGSLVTRNVLDAEHPLDIEVVGLPLVVNLVHAVIDSVLIRLLIIYDPRHDVGHIFASEVAQEPEAHEKNRLLGNEATGIVSRVAHVNVVIQSAS